MSVHHQLESLFDKLKVDQVVFVDNMIDKDTDVENVIALCSQLDDEQLSGIFLDFDGVIPDDEDIKNSQIRSFYEAMADDRKDAVFQSIWGFSESSEADDFESLSALAEIIPPKYLKCLNPAQWAEQQEEILGSDSGGSLFLFDRDFSDFGDSGGDKDGGIKIISTLLNSDTSESRICGLLTHTVDPSNEEKLREKIAKDNKLDIDRFMVISKKRIEEDQKGFIQILKLVALSPRFTEFKANVQKISRKATTKAINRIKSLTIKDFEHIVFSVPHKEGSWEPDMLFRLHNVFHRTESNRLAHAEGKLESLARDIREVREIPAVHTLVPSDLVREIQREELYEPTDFINGNHLPLELGDIFNKTGTTRNFILLGQPCHLMIRSNGKRSYNPERFPIAEIIEKKGSEIVPGRHEVVDYFSHTPLDPEAEYCIDLRKVSFVRICLLDLCCFHMDGTSAVNLSEESHGDHLRPNLRSRSVSISKEIKKWIGWLETAEKSGNLPKAVKDAVLKESPFQGELVSKSNKVVEVEFDCQRSERLSSDRAHSLLVAYSAMISKAAFDPHLD